MAEKTIPAESKEERVGYHKGSLSTLMGERAELMRLVQITDSLIQAHITELEKLGINLSDPTKNSSVK